MWCTKRRLEPCSTPCSASVVSSKELRLSEFLESSPVNEFLFQEFEKGDVKSVRFTSDIYMLFNQQRLDRMSRERLIHYFNDLSVREPQMAAIRSKLSDDQLCSFVKSRFIQSPSELMAWSQYLMASQDEMVAAAAAEQQTQQPAGQPDIDPTVEP